MSDDRGIHPLIMMRCVCNPEGGVYDVMSNAATQEPYLIVTVADISSGTCLQENNSTCSNGSLLMGLLCDHPAIIRCF